MVSLNLNTSDSNDTSLATFATWAFVFTQKHLRFIMYSIFRQ